MKYLYFFILLFITGCATKINHTDEKEFHQREDVFKKMEQLDVMVIAPASGFSPSDNATLHKLVKEKKYIYLKQH